MRQCLFILIFFVNSLFSQIEFYIQPELFPLKVHQTQNTSTTFQSKSNLDIQIKPLNYRSNLGKELFLGLSSGIKFKNQFIEIGLKNNSAVVSIQMKNIIYDQIQNNYYLRTITFNSGINMYMLSLRYGVPLTRIGVNKKSIMHFLVGLDVNFRDFRYSSFQTIKENDFSFSTDSSNTINITSTFYTGVKKRLINPCLGLKIEIPGKKREILSIQLQYTIPMFRENYLVASNIEITDIDNKTYTYHNYLSSGSGFFIGLSTPILLLKRSPKENTK